MDPNNMFYTTDNKFQPIEFVRGTLAAKLEPVYGHAEELTSWLAGDEAHIPKKRKTCITKLLQDAQKLMSEFHAGSAAWMLDSDTASLCSRLIFDHSKTGQKEYLVQTIVEARKLVRAMEMCMEGLKMWAEMLEEGEGIKYTKWDLWAASSMGQGRDVLVTSRIV